MTEENKQKQFEEAWWSNLKILMGTIKFLLLVSICIVLYVPFGKDLENWVNTKPTHNIKIKNVQENAEDDYDKVVNGFHVATGLKIAPGFEEVRANCTVCHSAKLVTQNKATRAGWDQMIDWMQETQGLWDLGPKRARILDYLAVNYAPKSVGRRANIKMEEVEWYILELSEE